MIQTQLFILVKQKMKAIITGGCGFIGHHLVEHLFVNTDWELFVLDKLSYASKGFDRIKDTYAWKSDRLHLFTTDLCQPLSEGIMKELGNIDIIFHLAAETHVDNSISKPKECILNNIQSTVNMLEYARSLRDLKTFLYFSTDEVYGPALGEKAFVEHERHHPSNPYSASKSASEQLCISYHNTYKLPVIITNVMNVFGQRQYVEKFIPKCIKQVLNEDTVLLHAYDNGETGSRFYIHARNVASAVLFIIQNGLIGETYHIEGEQEVSNLDMAQFIAKIVQKPLQFTLTTDHAARPGHDLRYGLNGGKLQKLGWSIPISFYQSLTETINWTLQHPEWLDE